MSWIRGNRYLLARRSVQLGILLLFWLGAHRQLGLLTGNLSASTVLRSVPLADPFAVLQILAAGQALGSTVLIGAGLVLLFYFAVGGRTFCSWVCPINPVADLGAWLQRRLGVTGQLRPPRGTRTWILALALLVSALCGVAAFEWISPIALMHRELIFGPGLGLLVVGAILLLDLFVLKDGWCGSLCPLGAFYGLVGRRSLLRMGFDAARCDRCAICVSTCPEKQVLDFHAMADRGFVDEGACTNCARCLEVCPREAFHFTLRFPGRAGEHLEEGDHHATRSAA